MTHIVSEDVFTPGFAGRGAKTESGTELQNFTAEDVTFALQLLAYNNTRFRPTSAQLETDYGISIHPNTLRKWVSSLFVEKYVEIQNQLANKLNEKIGNTLVDATDKAIQAQHIALDETINKLEDSDVIKDMTPAGLSLTAKNMSDVASKNIEKTQLIREKPTAIVSHKNPDEALKILEELGLMKKDEEPVDAEVVED